MQIKDRIKALRRVRASDLLPHPRNWRQHPPAQLDALKGVLAEIGWADCVVARETPSGLQILDGHARVGLNPDAEIPVLVVDLDDEEANKILATHDPIAMMAEANQETLDELLDNISTHSEALKEMLEGLRVDKWDVTEAEFPELPSGDKTTLCTMSFSVTANQRDTIQSALRKAKEAGLFGETGNANANGNALSRVCESYVEG
jgi:hypothetical protein